MKSNFIVLPPLVPLNSTLTIKSTTHDFPDSAYHIVDHSGRTVRKGIISKGSTEFNLSMVGMNTGVYHLKVGPEQERFTVI